MSVHVRWRDEDGDKHISTAASEVDQTWDLSEAGPLRAGMTISVGGVQMVLSDPRES